MATTYQSIIDQARKHLNETTANFWTDAELLALGQKGTFDLWRSSVDLKAEHYLTRNVADVTLTANSITLTGVPAGVYKIYLIEPVNNGDNGTNVNLHFSPLELNDPAFRSARAAAAVDPRNTMLYYAITGQGAPVAAPTIYVAPKVTSTVAIQLWYVPVLVTTDLELADNVAIPGEADQALISWIVAHARAKERDDRSPDPGWIALYGTEKTNLLQGLGQRQLQEPEYVKANFEEYW